MKKTLAISIHLFLFIQLSFSRECQIKIEEDPFTSQKTVLQKPERLFSTDINIHNNFAYYFSINYSDSSYFIRVKNKPSFKSVFFERVLIKLDNDKIIELKNTKMKTEVGTGFLGISSDATNYWDFQIQESDINLLSTSNLKLFRYFLYDGSAVDKILQLDNTLLKKQAECILQENLQVAKINSSIDLNTTNIDFNNIYNTWKMTSSIDEHGITRPIDTYQSSITFKKDSTFTSFITINGNETSNKGKFILNKDEKKLTLVINQENISEQLIIAIDKNIMKVQIKNSTLIYTKQY